MGTQEFKLLSAVVSLFRKEKIDEDNALVREHLKLNTELLELRIREQEILMRLMDIDERVCDLMRWPRAKIQLNERYVKFIKERTQL